MKIGFTTLGCPKWNLQQIIGCATRWGYHGVDFRGYMGEMAIYKLPEFSSDIAATRKKFADAGVEISGLSSGARLFSLEAGKLAGWLDEVKAYAPLAAELNAPFIRVFGGALQGANEEQAIEIAAASLEKMAGSLPRGVKIAVETHDDWVRSELLARLMSRVVAANVCVLWDIHHPYRLAGEKMAETYRNIGRMVEYTHVKDSRLKPDGKHEYTLPGEGDVPLAEAIGLLRQGGYRGYLTVEWEKVWIPDLAEPEVALPAYAEYLKKFGSSGNSGTTTHHQEHKENTK